MNSSKKIIPKIQEKIENKLLELDLIPKTKPGDFVYLRGERKHRYFSLCTNNQGEEVLFYARIHNNLDAEKKFKREIKFLSSIQENPKIQKIVPKIINWGIEEDFEWLQREEIHPPSIASWGKKNFSNDFVDVSEKLAKAVAQIGETATEKMNLETFDQSRFFAQKTIKQLVDEKSISFDLGQKIEKMIEKEIPAMKKNANHLSHGDLTLENILSDKKDVWVIDWEGTEKNNIAYDIGFLWSQLWFDKKSRESFLNFCLDEINQEKKEQFEIFFPVVVAYFNLGDKVMGRDKKEVEKFEEKRIFCLNVLENSVKGFEILKKI